MKILSKSFLTFAVVSLSFLFSTSVFAKSACSPSEDTILLLSEGGSIPSDSASFYYSASRLPRIAMCSDSGDLKNFFCIEWEGAVFDKSSKETKQGAKIVFDAKTGLVKDFLPSTNEKGFKYLLGGKLNLIEGVLKENIIEFINAQFIQTKVKTPQMTMINSMDKPNEKDSLQNTVKAILSLVKESTGSLHLNCGRTSKISSNLYKVL